MTVTAQGSAKVTEFHKGLCPAKELHKQFTSSILKETRIMTAIPQGSAPIDMEGDSNSIVVCDQKLIPQGSATSKPELNQLFGMALQYRSHCPIYLSIFHF
jgi:hypothetical protein